MERDSLYSGRVSLIFEAWCQGQTGAVQSLFVCDCGDAPACADGGRGTANLSSAEPRGGRELRKGAGIRFQKDQQAPGEAGWQADRTPADDEPHRSKPQRPLFID